ncbi:phBC6A51 family helix-turn-helix protein [Streptococcus dysgalactiae]|nr:phBC6A51 family helix-turn-helix protein [Streptococcus dysgalactiae]
MGKVIFLAVSTNKSQREIAEEIGISETTISRWKKTDEYKELKDKIQKEYLADLTAPAIRTLQGLLNAKSELVRFQAATDILDRTGYKPTDKQEISIDEPIVLANSWVQDNGS